MKKVLKLIAILLGIGIIAGCKNTPSKDRMNEELKKPEVVEVIEQALNPMGGIESYMIINGDNKLVIEPTLTRFNDKYGLGAGLLSEALSELLKKEK